MLAEPVVGDLVHVTEAASVQFRGDAALILRVLKVSEKPTVYGWCWITGYVLDRHGDAVGRREVFVQTAGLRKLRPARQTQKQVHRAWTPPRAGALV